MFSDLLIRAQGTAVAAPVSHFLRASSANSCGILTALDPSSPRTALWVVDPYFKLNLVRKEPRMKKITLASCILIVLALLISTQWGTKADDAPA